MSNKLKTLGTWVATATLFIIAGLLATAKSGPSGNTKETEIVSKQMEMPVKPLETNEPKFVVKKVTNINVSPDQVLYFDTMVTGESVDVAIALLTDMTDKHKDIYLLINSPGGSVFDGLRLISFIESSSSKIHTVCVFICASMAAHLHQSGAERLMEDSGLLMFHPATGGVQGQVDNMMSQVDTIQKIVNSLDAKASSKSNIPYLEFKRKVAFEYWVNPQEAISTKLADRLVYIRTRDSSALRGISVSKELMKINPMLESLKTKGPKFTLED